MGILIFFQVLVMWSCPTLCDTMNWSLPGSSVHEIIHARMLEWAAIPFFVESSLEHVCKENLSHILKREKNLDSSNWILNYKLLVTQKSLKDKWYSNE